MRSLANFLPCFSPLLVLTFSLSVLFFYCFSFSLHGRSVRARRRRISKRWSKRPPRRRRKSGSMWYSVDIDQSSFSCDWVDRWYREWFLAEENDVSGIPSDSCLYLEIDDLRAIVDLWVSTDSSPFLPLGPISFECAPSLLPRLPVFSLCLFSLFSFCLFTSFIFLSLPSSFVPGPILSSPMFFALKRFRKEVLGAKNRQGLPFFCLVCPFSSAAIWCFTHSYPPVPLFFLFLMHSFFHPHTAIFSGCLPFSLQVVSDAFWCTLGRK